MMLGDTHEEQYTTQIGETDKIAACEGEETIYPNKTGWWTSVVIFIKHYISSLIKPSSESTTKIPAKDPKSSFVTMYKQKTTNYLPSYSMNYSLDFPEMPLISTIQIDEAEQGAPPVTQLPLFTDSRAATTLCCCLHSSKTANINRRTDMRIIAKESFFTDIPLNISHISSQSYYTKKTEEPIDYRRNSPQTTVPTITKVSQTESLPSTKVAVHIQNYGVRIVNVSDLVADINQNAKLRNQPKRTKAGPFRRSFKLVLKHKLQRIFKRKTCSLDVNIITEESFYKDF